MASALVSRSTTVADSVIVSARSAKPDGWSGLEPMLRMATIVGGALDDGAVGPAHAAATSALTAATHPAMAGRSFPGRSAVAHLGASTTTITPPSSAGSARKRVSVPSRST